MSKRTFFISILLAGILGSLLTTGTTWLLSSTFVSDTIKSRGMSMHQIPPWQMYLSNDLAFLNTTSLTAGDLLYYDATNAEWLNTQGQGTISGIGSSPAITLKNPTAEDTAGGRESTIAIKGHQSGNEESTLGNIVMSHDGSADDQKGRMIFSINDGNDNNAPSEVIRIDSDKQVGISTTNPLYPMHITGNTAITTGSLLITAGNYGVFDATAATYGIRPRNSSDALEIRTNSITRITVSTTGEVTFTQGIIPAAKTADPCGSGFPESAIFWNTTGNYLCVCDGTNDVQVSDGTTACF